MFKILDFATHWLIPQGSALVPVVTYILICSFSNVCDLLPLLVYIFYFI
jgi:hypothetical protein